MALGYNLESYIYIGERVFPTHFKPTRASPRRIQLSHSTFNTIIFSPNGKAQNFSQGKGGHCKYHGF